MATILVEILGNAKQFKAELAGAEAATARASGGFAKFGKAAGIAGLVLAGGVAYGMGKALNAAGDFEQKLNILQSVTQGTNREMAEASRLAIKLGADAKLPAVSAADAAEAMLQLGKAGFTMHQSMAAARGTLLLATAAEIDGALAAKTVTQAVHAFGLKAKDTNVIVDNMAGFMNTTGTTFEELADSLSYVAAPAHAVGQSFKETAAQLAILSQNGQEGSKAGTGLRKMLNELVAGKARGFFHDLGVETVNANDKFIGMHALIQKLHPILEKMTAPERLGLMKQAFGLTAMNQANILLGTSVGLYDKATDSIGKKGQADKLAAAHMEGYKGALAQLSSALETIQIEIGLKLLPIATRFALWLTAELPVAVNAAQQAIAFLTPYFLQVKTAVEQVVAAVRAHWTEISAVIRSVVDVIRAQLNLFGDLIHGRWNKIWSDVVDIVKSFGGLVVSSVKLIGPLLLAALEKVGEMAVDGLVAGLKALPGALKAGLQALPGLALAGATLVGDAIVKGVKSAVPKLSGLAGDMTAKIGDAISQVAGWAYTAAVGVGNAIVDGVVAGLSDLKDKVTSILSYSLLDAIHGAKKKALKASSPSVTAAEELGQPIGEGVIQGWLTSSASLPSAMSTSLQAAITAGRAVIETAKASFQTAWSQIASDADAAFSGIAGAKKTPAEKELASTQAARDKAGRDQALVAAQAQLAQAQAAGDAAAQLAAQKQVDDAQYAIHVAALQKTAEAERIELDARNALRQRHFDEALVKLQTHLANGHSTYEEAHKAILKLFKSFGINYTAAGANLGAAFVTGLKESIREAAKKSGALNERLENVAAGIHIPHAATGGFVAQTGLAVIHQGETITPGGGGGNVYVTVEGWVGNDQDIAERIRNALIRTGRNTTGGALGRFA